MAPGLDTKLIEMWVFLPFSSYIPKTNYTSALNEEPECKL